MVSAGGQIGSGTKDHGTHRHELSDLEPIIDVVKECVHAENLTRRARCKSSGFSGSPLQDGYEFLTEGYIVDGLRNH